MQKSAGSEAPAGTVTSPTISQEHLRNIAIWEAGLLRLHASLLHRVAEGEQIENGKYSIDRRELINMAHRAMLISSLQPDNDDLKLTWAYVKMLERRVRENHTKRKRAAATSGLWWSLPGILTQTMLIYPSLFFLAMQGLRSTASQRSSHKQVLAFLK